MKNIEIIQLVPSDWKIVKNLRIKSVHSDPEAFKDTYEEMIAKPDSYWIEKTADPRAFYVVAKADEEYVGILGAVRKTKEPNIILLMKMYVDRAYRGQGIGKQLMSVVLEKIRENKNIAKIILWVEESQVPAFNMYKSFGFRIVPVEKNIDYPDVTMMEKENI
jgi:ribosomal protein S18 acetylase RimI-like enzyme